MRLTTAIIFSCVMLTAPICASAQTTANAASAHTANGNKALRAGQYQKALSEFVLAYTHNSSSVQLYDLGRAFEALKNTAAALTVYKQVIARGPSRVMGLASQRLSALSRGPSAAGPKVSVMVNVIPPGAEVWINNELKGKSPVVSFQVARGNHTMEIRLPGYKTQVVTLNTTSGAPVNKVYTMIPGTSPPPASRQETSMSLTVLNIPSQSKVTLNGKQVSYQGNQTRIDVAAGTYKLIVSNSQLGVFDQTVTLAAGQSRVIPVKFKGASVGAPSDSFAPAANSFAPAANSIAGKWNAVAIKYNKFKQVDSTASMTLNGTGSTLRGTLVLKITSDLARWKARQCGTNKATWEVKYSVNASQQDGNWTLKGRDGTMVSCSCDGMCRSDNEFEWPLLVAQSKTVMVGNRLVFTRKSNSNASGRPFLSSINRSNTTAGKWQMQLQSDEEIQRGALSFNRSSATLTLNSSEKLQRWQQRSCNGAKEVTATHEYTVSPTIQGDTIALTFKHSRTLKCSCSNACESTIQRLGTINVSVTKDGRHMVSENALLNR